MNTTTTIEVEHEIDLSAATLHNHGPLPPDRPGRVDYRDMPNGRQRLVFIENVTVAPEEVPHVRVEVHGPAWRKLEPLEVLEYPAWVPGVEPLELHGQDAILARLVPADAKLAGDGAGMPLLVCEALAAEHGHDDDGAEVSPEHARAGAAAMRPALLLAGAWRADPIRLDVRGEVEVLLRMAEGIGRSYGMSGDEIAAATKRPFCPRRSLWEPMAKARELGVELAAARARAEELASTVRAVAIEEERPRTYRELGVDAVAVAADRFGSVSPEPFPGAKLLAIVQGARLEHVYGWRAVPFAPLPRFERDGLRSVSDDVAPKFAHALDANLVTAPLLSEAVRPPSVQAIGFLRSCIAEFGGDMGPVPSFEIDVRPELREFVAKHGEALVRENLATAYLLDLVAEVVTRSKIGRLRPDVGAALILDEMDKAFRALPEKQTLVVPSKQLSTVLLEDGRIETRREGPPQTIEMYAPEDLPSRRSRGAVGRACAAAAKAGAYVRVGGTSQLEELIASTKTNATKTAPRAAGRGK